MAKKLVKTGWEIRQQVQRLLDDPKIEDYRMKKFLVLPDGLDRLELMLMNGINADGVLGLLDIKSVIARFKKENEI